MSARLPLSERDFAIITQRLLLRPFALSDYETWVRAQGELLPPQNRFDRAPLSPKDLTRARFAAWVKARHRLAARDLLYQFGVFDRKTGVLYGQFTLLILARSLLQIASLGYEIYNNRRRRGYAQEAAEALVTFAFRKLSLHRVEVGADPANLASIAVARSIGMKHEGIKKGYVFDGKKWLDLRTFSARAEEYGIRGRRPSVRVELGS